MPHGSVLRIEPVKQKDLGVYECIADNGVGTKARANASLHVYPKTGECLLHSLFGTINIYAHT